MDAARPLTVVSTATPRDAISRSASRDERNLRILESIPEKERTISQKFHVFQSLIALDRNEEAIPKAIEFIGLDGVGKNERYEAFFQLARLANDSETKKSMLLQALAVDPTRREAYGELALANIPDDPQSSLGWTDAMNSLTIHRDAPWNLRRSYYGQLGVGLRGMALRANNRREEADALETNHFISNGAKISLIHATRGRPALAWRTRMEWLRSASNPDAIEHIFAIDATDPASFLLTNTRSVVVRGNGGPVDAWNVAASQSKGQFLVQLSDDWQPFPGWDTAILNELEKSVISCPYCNSVCPYCAPSPNLDGLSQPRVLAVSDGHRTDDLLCMAIMTRARYQQQGYMFHPEFFSMFSDNWFSECAFRDGVVIDARDRIVFEHVHPAFGKAEMDETYARSNDQYHYQTGAGILRRLREGIKVSSEMEGWFDFQDVYDHVAKLLNDGELFVEVGSWKGKSVSYLYDRIEDTGKTPVIFAIDTFNGDSDTGKVDVYDEFTSNIGERRIGVMRETSLEASQSTFHPRPSGVFIDAAHDYESVKADITAWRDKVKPGGFFGGHDVDAEGVQRALADCGVKYQTVGRCWIQTNE